MTREEKISLFNENQEKLKFLNKISDDNVTNIIINNLQSDWRLMTEYFIKLLDKLGDNLTVTNGPVEYIDGKRYECVTGKCKNIQDLITVLDNGKLIHLYNIFELVVPSSGQYALFVRYYETQGEF